MKYSHIHSTLDDGNTQSRTPTNHFMHLGDSIAAQPEPMHTHHHFLGQPKLEKRALFLSLPLYSFTLFRSCYMLQLWNKVPAISYISCLLSHLFPPSHCFFIELLKPVILCQKFWFMCCSEKEVIIEIVQEMNGWMLKLRDNAMWQVLLGWQILPAPPTSLPVSDSTWPSSVRHRSLQHDCWQACSLSMSVSHCHPAVTQNKKVFPILAQRLASGDIGEYLVTMNKLKNWLKLERAYYPAGC